MHFRKWPHYLDTVTHAAEKDEYLGLETLVRSVPCTFHFRCPWIMSVEKHVESSFYCSVCVNTGYKNIIVSLPQSSGIDFEIVTRITGVLGALVIYFNSAHFCQGDYSRTYICRINYQAGALI